MGSQQFSIEHLDEQEYTYNAAETTVKVRIDDVRNGGRVGVHHYDESGTKMNYYSMNINSVDDRRIVVSDADEATEIPDAVLRALHAGGWQLGNLQRGNLVPEEDAPIEVQLLDIRDGLEDYAEQTNSDLNSHYFASLARAVEIGLTADLTLRHADDAGFDNPDDAFDMIGQDIGYDTNAIEPEHIVEGLFENAVRPETQHSTEERRELVRALEQARAAYRAGDDFGDAFTDIYGL